MPRIDLNVPYAEKDEAKKLGAKWDAEKKVWYVPDGTDVSNFSKWLPPNKPPPVIQVLANYIWIAEAAHKCWHCGETTSVFGFLLAPPYDLESEDEETDNFAAKICEQRTPCFMTFSIFFSEDALTAVQSLTKNFREDFSKTANSSYWMNHCDKCDAKIGDFNIFDNHGPFDLDTKEKATQLKFHLFDGHMEAECYHIADIGYLNSTDLKDASKK